MNLGFLLAYLWLSSAKIFLSFMTEFTPFLLRILAEHSLPQLGHLLDCIFISICFINSLPDLVIRLYPSKPSTTYRALEVEVPDRQF